MKQLNAFKFIILPIVLSLFFNSCTKKASKYSDSTVFRYNEHANITTLDPAFSKNQASVWACNQLFNGLVQLNDSLEVQPDIAKYWKIGEDQKTYTFYLRDDVYFHKHKLFGNDSTRKVTAFDVAYSLNRLLDPQVASPGGWVLQQVSTMKAVNDTTFMVTLKQPFPPFLALLSMKYCSVIAKEAIAYLKDNFRTHPIGTGPFYTKLWVENTKLVLRKNNNYHEKDNKGNSLPYLEAVAITFLSDKQSEFLQLAQGNLDLLSGLDPSYKDEVLNSEGKLAENYQEQLKMYTAPFLNTEYLGIYMGKKGVANHPLLRKAMNMGFDREKMIQYLRNGMGTPAIHGFIPKGLPSFNYLKGYTYDLQKAMVLVNQYISETGNQNPAVTISTNSAYVDICEYIQRELGKIGIEVKIDVLPPSTLRQGKSNGKLHVFRASWIADYPDAENYLSLFYSKNFAPNGPNYTHFSNKEFDKLYEKAIKTTDNSKRHQLYQAMDSIVISEAPIIPLYYDQAVRFSPKSVHGLGINPINLLQLKRVYKSERN